MVKYYAHCALVLLMVACSQPKEKIAPFYTSVQGFHRNIGSSSSEAQQYFDQGLLFYYGYHFDDAERAFRAAVHLDPKCAMCYWGMALALGSKSYTKLQGDERARALEALQQARELAVSGKDRAYIEALSARYSDSTSPKDMTVSDTEAQAYTEAMRKLATQFPDDADAQVLYVNAVMIGLKDFYIDGKPHKDTKAVLAVLNKVLKDNPKHPGANHYYIHLTEGSEQPGKALPNADFLDTAKLGVEHLEHMPAHVYLLIGEYHKATLANQRAIKVHHAYQAEARAQGFEPVKSYLLIHDLHFLWVSSMMEGRGQLAIDTAKELRSRAQEDKLYLFYPFPYFAEARFGRWDEILQEPQPEENDSSELAFWHYVRGLALAHKGKLQQAKEHLTQLTESVSTSNKSNQDIKLKIAAAVLTATIADKSDDNTTMLKSWQEAVELQKSLGFQDPPVWYFPTEEGLAAAFLKLNQPKDAEEVIKNTLKYHPENGWSLYLLAQSLRAQGRNKEADEVDQRFKTAWYYADTIPK